MFIAILVLILHFAKINLYLGIFFVLDKWLLTSSISHYNSKLQIFTVMNKKLEEKILEELKKRVLETEEQLNARKEHDSMKEATIEALADMTSLSETDVSVIERQIRAEVTKKQLQRKRLIMAISVVAICISLPFIWKILTHQPPFSLTENFDDNKNGWKTFDIFEYDRKIENGGYLFEVNVADWCYWDNVILNLPESYTIEATSAWKSGKRDEFGLVLMQSNKHYAAFQIRADGAARFGKNINGEWVVSDSWRDSLANTGSQPNTQKIVVDNRNFKYYVNNRIIREGNFNDLAVDKVGVRVCDKQVVEFLDIKVTNNLTGDILFSDSFDDATKGWIPKQLLTRRAKLENGFFTFATTSEDSCFWSSITVQDEDKKVLSDGNYDISLVSYWKEGDGANFGLMIMQDNDSYFAFELKSDGSTRVVRCSYNQYVEVPEYITGGVALKPDVPVVQKIKVRHNDYEYFINDKLISSGNFSYMYLTDIGLRVCGNQSISFDKLVIEEQ